MNIIAVRAERASAHLEYNKRQKLGDKNLRACRLCRLVVLLGKDFRGLPYPQQCEAVSEDLRFLDLLDNRSDYRPRPCLRLDETLEFDPQILFEQRRISELRRGGSGNSICHRGLRGFYEPV